MKTTLQQRSAAPITLLLVAILNLLSVLPVCSAEARTSPLSDGTIIEWSVRINGRELDDLTSIHPEEPVYNAAYQSLSIPDAGNVFFSATLPLSYFTGSIAQITISVENQDTASSVFDYFIYYSKADDGTISYYMDSYFNYVKTNHSAGYIGSGGMEFSVDQTFTKYSADSRTVHFAAVDNPSIGESRIGQIFIWRSPSAGFIMGNSPEKEGLCEENPYTVCQDKEGPASCSINGQGLPGYAVNTASRGLIIEDRLFTADSLGPPMILALQYSPVPTRSGMFGNGWSFSLDDSLDAGCGGSLVRKGTHQVVGFSGILCPADSLAYPVSLTPAKGNFDRLDRHADRFEYRPKGSRSTRIFGLEQPAGRWLLTAIKDRNDNTLSLYRNAQGRIASITDAAGRTASLAYDEAGRCTRLDTPDGRHATFAYSPSGNLTRVTDLAGIATDYAYNAENYLTSMTVGDKTTTFAYDTLDKGALASLTDANGHMVVYARDVSTNAISRTDANNHATVYRNIAGKTSRITDALGRVTDTTFDDATGLPLNITAPGDLVTSRAYDARGNPTTVTRSGGALSQTWTMTYDANDNLLTRVDPLGKTWSFAYDQAGNLASATTPTGLTTAYTRDVKGLPLTMTLPGNRTWTFQHDAKGNMTRSTDPLGKAANFAYDTPGLNLLAATDPRGFVTAYQYDANRRPTRVTWPTGAFRQIEYACCAPLSVTDERGGTVSMTHDGLMRLTSQTNPYGGATTFSHDAGGNLTGLANPLGHAATLTYDAIDRLIGSTDPRGTASQVFYNALGLPVTYQDHSGYGIMRATDALGRPNGLTDQLGKTVSLTLDAAGRTTRLTNARGQTIDYEYDDDGRPTVTRHNGAQVAALAYGPTGKLASFASAGYGTTTYARDVAGRITGIAYPDGNSVALTYDDAGNIASVAYPGGLTATYAHTSRNQVSALAFGPMTMSLGYDPAGNLISETRSNGASSSYGFDVANRLTSLSHAQNGTPFVQLAYARNILGQVSAVNGAQPNEPWQQAASETGTFDEANRLTAFGAETASLDDDGNVTALSGPRGFAAVYDPANRPTSLTVGGQTATFVHDGLGNRVRRTRGGVVRDFHYDHLGRLLFETDGTGAVTLCHVYAGPRLVASGTLSGGFRFQHQDLTGNTLALTDASGSIVAAYAYDPFGRVLSKTGSAAADFTFVGAFGVMDEGNGIFFMRNRYYDAHGGRFLQKDPIGAVGGMNLYRYVGNNPVTRIDPSGLAPTDEEIVGYHEYRDASRLIPDPTTRKNLRFINDALTSADIVLSAQPGLRGRLYTSLKCGFISVTGGGLNKPGVADDVLWELLKMVAGLPGAIFDFWDAGNERNVQRSLESHNEMLKMQAVGRSYR